MSAVKRLISPLKPNNEVINSKKQKLHFQAEPGSDSIDCLAEFFEEGQEENAFFDISSISPPLLDLSEWQRCRVEKLERTQRTFDLLLFVQTEHCIGFTKCHLQGPWAHTKVNVGEIVSLKAMWDSELCAYKVDKDQGFCVTNADFLLSGTTVVGSLFCQRKAVLQDRFRGIDANSRVMVVGSLVHELLQSTLVRRLSSFKEIEMEASELLQSQDTAYMLYGSLLTSEETALEVHNFVPNIVSFVQKYVKGKTIEQKPQESKDFHGTITNIADIEENLWVPKLGLKGKIDVSVNINRSRDSKRTLGSSKYALPLELKTGRASFSMEHKGQLILYQMLLEAIGCDTSSGLLLYLREGILREVRSGRNEQRDLISLRNELAYYLTRYIKPAVSDNTQQTLNTDGKLYQPFELPEPISHHSACSNCAYATICSTFVKTDPELNLRDNHPLKKVMQDVTNHLRAQDYEYFMHWCTLLALEEQDDRQSNFQRALWTEKPEARQRLGRAIINLRLHGDVQHDKMRYIHTLGLENENDDVDFILSGFCVGEYVIVSTQNRIAVAAGFLQDISQSMLSVSLERDLRQNYADQIFIVDKHESQSTMVFNYTNLGILLDKTERSAALREIIIDKKAPTFVKSLPKVILTKGKEILEKLNCLQRKAVLKALTTESYMLIKGLPGTGKTQTLATIVRLLHLMGKSVVITSHTHSAVDNLLLRLQKYNLPMLRLGSSARVHPDLQNCAESHVMKDCKSEKQLSQKYGSYSIIGVTCLGSSHSIFLHRHFDFCIVDEATQVMQPNVLRPLYYCSKFVLVGDPDQLPPVLRSNEARKRGADITLFQSLDSVAATTTLSQQYRMNKTITKLANDLTYNGVLECGSSDVATATLSNISLNTLTQQQKWLQRMLQTHIDQAVFLLNTTDCSTRSLAFASTKHSSTCALIEQKYAENSISSPPTKQLSQKKRLSKYTNYCEVAIVLHLVKTLLLGGFEPAGIGIIAPYRAQVELLRKFTKQYHQYYQKKDTSLNFTAVEINTVDQYQGRDKEIIIYSGTKTSLPRIDNLERPRDTEILEDKRRLTVAITRAKHKLIIVADAACLEQYTPFQSLFKHIPKLCRLRLEDEKFGFSWKAMFDELLEIIDN